MKKLLLFAVMLLASAHGFAQYEAGTMTWIPKLGVNLSKMGDGDVFYKGDGVGDQLMKPKFTIGVVAGIEGEYHMSSLLGLSAGVLYSMQGTAYDDVDMQKDYSVAFHCVNVPVLLNFHIVGGLALKAGIQASYAFYKKESFKENLGGWKEFSTSGSGYGNFDLSVPVGISYDFDKIRVDLRYNYGLLDLAKRDYMDPIHSRVFQLSVGYCLGK